MVSLQNPVASLNAFILHADTRNSERPAAADIGAAKRLDLCSRIRQTMSGMKVARQRTRRTPDYPRRDVFIHHPELLRGFTPLSWKTKSALLAALFAFTACGREPTDGQDTGAGPTPPGLAQSDSTTDATPRSVAAKRDSSHVAPLFIHGEARGTFGCIVVSPPVVLSEADARLIIEETLTSAGIAVDSPGPEVGGGWFGRHGIMMDASSRRHRFAYKLVCVQNWQYLCPNEGSTVMSVNLVDCAQYLRASLHGKTPLNIAIFYTPFVIPNEHDERFATYTTLLDALETDQFPARVPDTIPVGVFGQSGRSRTGEQQAVERNPDGGTSAAQRTARLRSAVRDAMTNAARDDARALLRAQVEDFIEWLKANQRL